MGFRFRKSIKLFPGFKINLTHKGISSASIGKPGASLNIGKKSTRTSVGIPGTGLSYSKHQPYSKKTRVPQPTSLEHTEYNPQNLEQPKTKIWPWIIFGILCFMVGAVIF